MLLRVFILLALLSPVVAQQGQPPSILTTNQASHPQKNGAASIRKKAIDTLAPLLHELMQVDNLQQKVTLAQPLVRLLSRTHAEECQKLLSELFDECLRLRSEKRDSPQETYLDPDLLAKKIIQISASLDRKFAKSLLEKYDTAGSSDQNKSPSTDLSRIRFHLSVASELIEENVELASSVAEKVISGSVIPETLVFLDLLRQKDLLMANRLFAMALAGLRMRGGADPNESLLLFSYVFCPQQIPVITPQGLGVYHLAAGSPLPAYRPNVAVAQQYLDNTTALLLDPARYGRPNLPPTFGPRGDWLLIKFIQPEAAIYRPSLTNPLLAQQYVLENRMEDRKTEALASLDRWNSSSGQTSGPRSATVESLLKQAEQAANTKRKDQLLYRAAMAAIRAGEYDRALQIADELSIEYRNEAKQFLNFSIAVAVARKEDIAHATRLAEKDDDLLRRAYVFTLIAESLIERKEADMEQARFYLSAVEDLIPKLPTDAERVSAINRVIQIYSRFDRAKAFESLQELIRYANKVDSFAGEMSVSRLLDIGGYTFDYSLYDDSSLDETLKKLAVLDFETTLEDVSQLESRIARLKSTVAVCKSVLS